MDVSFRISDQKLLVGLSPTSLNPLIAAAASSGLARINWNLVSGFQSVASESSVGNRIMKKQNQCWRYFFRTSSPSNSSTTVFYEAALKALAKEPGVKR
jgi:hypothetical protein